MRVIGFGDSFTAGEGTDNQYVEQLSTFEKIEKYQKEHSWPRYLADKIGVKYVNNGEVGSSNYRIFSNIFEQFAYNNINNDDLVVIMWSSPLRDPLPFFPHMFSRTSPIGLSWSMKEFMSQDTQEWKNRYYEHYGKTEKSEIKYIENDLLKFMEEYFSQYDSISQVVQGYIPHQWEGQENTVVSVASREIKYKKDGTIEDERLFERFFIKDNKIFRVMAWSAEWNTD